MMKKILFTSILITSFQMFSQSPRRLTKKDSIKIETLVTLEINKLKQSLEGNDRELYNEFKIDTFRIKERQRLQLEIDYSTLGMVSATHEATKEYDKLLNKYYKRLKKNLNKEDQEILKQSQRNWIKFRDSELKLNSALVNAYFSGGGTIQQVIAASRVEELTEKRVIELFHYLNRKF